MAPLNYISSHIRTCMTAAVHFFTADKNELVCVTYIAFASLYPMILEMYLW
jgi:hypothetical protein